MAQVAEAPGVEVVRVRSNSKPGGVAGCIAGCAREGKPVQLHSIGASALNQGTKAVIIARGWLVPCGIDIKIVNPRFKDVVVEGDERTSIVCDLEFVRL